MIDRRERADIRAATVPARCTTCQVLEQAPLACADCHDLLAHVQGADYFELFGLPRRYDLDERELARKYLLICRNIHPDRFAAAGEEMQSFALRASAAINRAHEVLSHPHLRAEYLLESSGGKSAAQDKSVPADLLVRVMEIREGIEEAKSERNHEALSAFQRTIEGRLSETRARIAGLCARLTGDSAQAEKDELRRQLNAVKYLENLLAQLG